MKFGAEKWKQIQWLASVNEPINHHVEPLNIAALNNVTITSITMQFAHLDTVSLYECMYYLILSYLIVSYHNLSYLFLLSLSIKLWTLTWRLAILYMAICTVHVYMLFSSTQKCSVLYNECKNQASPFLSFPEESSIITLMLCKWALRYQGLSNYLMHQPLPTAERSVRKALYSFRKWPTLV